MLEQLDRRHRFSVWLKIDTGMNRLGFPVTAAAEATRRLVDCDVVADQIRFLTHLSSAAQPDKSTTTDQIGNFEHFMEGVDAERSIANSAGVIAWPNSHADWVRPGLMLYGVSPLKDKTALDLGLRPAMTLTSENFTMSSFAMVRCRWQFSKTQWTFGLQRREKLNNQTLRGPSPMASLPWRSIPTGWSSC